mmetsp:Transcript_6047/g.13006  ORF Transcript_6047/g.13006 Transcript_6047/m.13006 type:complete len:270 (-) Transcript_6047:568-1377(-)
MTLLLSLLYVGSSVHDRRRCRFGRDRGHARPIFQPIFQRILRQDPHAREFAAPSRRPAVALRETDARLVDLVQRLRSERRPQLVMVPQTALGTLRRLPSSFRPRARILPVRKREVVGHGEGQHLCAHQRVGQERGDVLARPVSVRSDGPVRLEQLDPEPLPVGEEDDQLDAEEFLEGAAVHGFGQFGVDRAEQLGQGEESAGHAGAGEDGEAEGSAAAEVVEGGKGGGQFEEGAEEGGGGLEDRVLEDAAFAVDQVGFSQGPPATAEAA